MYLKKTSVSVYIPLSFFSPPYVLTTATVFTEALLITIFVDSANLEAKGVADNASSSCSCPSMLNLPSLIKPWVSMD